MKSLRFLWWRLAHVVASFQQWAGEAVEVCTVEARALPAPLSPRGGLSAGSPSPPGKASPKHSLSVAGAGSAERQWLSCGSGSPSRVLVLTLFTNLPPGCGH